MTNPLREAIEAVSAHIYVKQCGGSWLLSYENVIRLRDEAEKALAELTKTDKLYDQWTALGAQYDDLEARVARAERIIAEKNKALGVAFNEMNAIRARDGAPQHIDWYKGRPLQTSSCTEEWFAQATDIISAALALRLDEEQKQDDYIPNDDMQGME